MKNKKLIPLILTLLLLIAGFFYIKHNDFKTDVSIQIECNGNKGKSLEIRYDKNRRGEKKIKFADKDMRFKFYNFQVNLKKNNSLYLYIGGERGTITIKKIKIKSFLSEYNIERESLYKILNKNTAEIRSIKPEYGNIHFNSSITIDITSLLEIIQKFASAKTIYYLFLIALSLFLYFILSSLKFPKIQDKSLKMSHKVFLNIILSAFVCFPFFLSILSYSDIGEKIEEIRKISTQIDFRTDALHPTLENAKKFYKDNFLFHNLFIHLNSRIKTNLFNISPVEMVILGKNDWLFLGKEDKKANQIRYYRGLKPFSNQELANWKQTLEERRDFLKARGIKYLFVIVPNKSTIYPEYLPDYIKKVRNKTRLDQLLQYLKNTSSDLEIVDMRSEYLKWKKTYKLYRKSDTHWSFYGSYLGYKIIMERIKRLGFKVDLTELDSFKFEIHRWKKGDLARMISQQNTRYKENKRWIVNKTGGLFDWELKNYENPKLITTIKYPKNNILGTTLFVHDSFGYKLRFFMSPHFKKILYNNDWNLKFDPKIIEKEKPVLVIEEMVERYLDRINFYNPQVLKSKSN